MMKDEKMIISGLKRRSHKAAECLLMSPELPKTKTVSRYLIPVFP